LKTLLISNYLQSKYLASVTFSQWTGSHPSLADFQCVVLDMKLNTISSLVISDIPTVHYKGFPFYVLFDDIIRLLRSGGVVICLNYYTFANESSKFTDGHSKTHKAIYEKRIRNYSYEYKYQGAYETSYDWLDLDLLKCTEVDRLNAMPGSQFKVISDLDVVKDYFLHVKEYHKTIHGIQDSPTVGVYRVRWVFRDDPAYEHATYTSDEVEILAVTEVTNEPIAITIKYRGFPGRLIFLPTYELSSIVDSVQEETSHSIAWRLHRLGEYYFRQSQIDQGIRLPQPSWLLAYRAKPAEEADKEIQEIDKAKDLLIAKRDKHDRMLNLINGYGKPLENTIMELFGKSGLDSI
jgi:hypothetical protein